MAPWNRPLSRTVPQRVPLAQTRAQRSQSNSRKTVLFWLRFYLLCRSSSRLILKEPMGSHLCLLTTLAPA